MEWNLTTPSLLPSEVLFSEGPGTEFLVGDGSRVEVVLGEGSLAAQENVTWNLYNQTTNSSVATATDSTTQQQVYKITMPVIIAFCVASGLVSSAVVCATPWIKRPMSPTVRLSLSLAAANTVFSASLTVAVVVNSYLPIVHGISLSNCVKLSIEAVRMGSILVQIMHLLVVALNHYMGTLRPLHYTAIMTPFTLKVILVGLWMIPMVGMFVAFSCIPSQGFQSQDCHNNYFYIRGVTFRIVWTALFFGPTVLISMIYCHIFHLLQDRALYLVSAEQRNQLRRNIKTDPCPPWLTQQTVRTTALIVGTFVVGWGPAVVKHLLVCDECVIKPTDISMTLNFAISTTFNLIFCLKVFTDTFIYAVQLRDVRKALQAMWVPLKSRVTGRPSGPIRNMSRISHTASTRFSHSSPALRSVCTSLAHRSRRSSPCTSNSRAKSASPTHQPPHVTRTSSGGGALPPSPHYNSSSWSPVTLEISVYANNHHSDDRLKTLVEETPLDPILEDDPDHLQGQL